MSKPARRRDRTYVGVHCTPELLAAIDELARRRSTPAVVVTRSDVIRTALVAAFKRAEVTLEAPLAKVGT